MCREVCGRCVGEEEGLLGTPVQANPRHFLVNRDEAAVLEELLRGSRHILSSRRVPDGDCKADEHDSRTREARWGLNGAVAGHKSLTSSLSAASEKFSAVTFMLGDLGCPYCWKCVERGTSSGEDLLFGRETRDGFKAISFSLSQKQNPHRPTAS